MSGTLHKKPVNMNNYLLLIKALEDLVAECPIHLSCDDFHHNSKDQHDAGEPCPPLNRYSKALRDAEKILESWDDEY